MEKKVSINQRISINIIEMAMKAALSGSFSPEYAYNLASGEFSGENRIRKARGLIGKLTVRNPIFPFIPPWQGDTPPLSHSRIKSTESLL